MTNLAKGLSLRDVQITDAFWAPRQRLITDVTIPYMEQILRDEVHGAEPSHAIMNFKIAAGEETGKHYGMVFQDSDVYKWLEAAAYALALKPDLALEVRMDKMIATIEKAQQPDGYLNTYFQLVEPEYRWQNLLECHELYCAGHLMEAATAYYEALGKTNLLTVAEKFAQHIIKQFGDEGLEGIPGHQEVEIGLMRLYHVTDNDAYLHMAERFLALRGQDPDYFIKHTKKNPATHYGGYDLDPADTVYNQSYAPVKEQNEGRGHAVRCVYMLIAMADVAAAKGDAALQRACERMFENITGRRMYVTGTIGSSAHHESFSEDFDLPNDRGYGETCASVAMFFFGQKMLLLSPQGKYADLMEKEVYNAALAGMQLDGKRFFYVNPLEVDPALSGSAKGLEHVLPQRPQWHACACCPPNLARLIASLGKYLWSENSDTLYSHLFIGNQMHSQAADITLTTGYPWQGDVNYLIEACHKEGFTLAIHVPSHVESFTLLINGVPTSLTPRDGYLYINRSWQKNDLVQLQFPLTCRRLYADERVRDNLGCVSLARGPFVYCLEGIDNQVPLANLHLPQNAAVQALAYDDTLLGGIVPITSKDAALYAIPYYAWSNRGKTAMRVWIHE